MRIITKDKTLEVNKLPNSTVLFVYDALEDRFDYERFLKSNLKVAEQKGVKLTFDNGNSAGNYLEVYLPRFAEVLSYTMPEEGFKDQETIHKKPKFTQKDYKWTKVKDLKDGDLVFRHHVHNALNRTMPMQLKEISVPDEARPYYFLPTKKAVILDKVFVRFPAKK